MMRPCTGPNASTQQRSRGGQAVEQRIWPLRLRRVVLEKSARPVTSNLAIHSPISGRWNWTLSVRNLMPVVHHSAAEMTENEPEHRCENCLKRWIHGGRITGEDGSVKRKSAPKSFEGKILPVSY